MIRIYCTRVGYWRIIGCNFDIEKKSCVIIIIISLFKFSCNDIILDVKKLIGNCQRDEIRRPFPLKFVSRGKMRRRNMERIVLKRIFRRNNISTFTCRCTRWRGNTECLGSRRRSSSGISGRFGVSKRERKLTARFHISTIRCKGSPSRSIISELSAWNLTSTLTSRWTGETRLSIKCTMRFLGYGKFISYNVYLFSF